MEKGIGGGRRKIRKYLKFLGITGLLNCLSFAPEARGKDGTFKTFNIAPGDVRYF
jgi:hypothetical protein